MPSPFFSICIPVYNGEEFIVEAIETVLGQKFTDWNLVIIDNLSTDRTFEIVQARCAGDPRIRVLRNETNLGMHGNLRRCMEEATGEWVGILPADDGYRSHTLQAIHEYVRERDDLILWTHARLAIGEGKVPDVIAVHKYAIEFDADRLAERLYVQGNLYGGLANYFVRRSAAENAGVIFLEPGISVDTRFWMRTLKGNPGAKAVYWPDVLAFMREHPESASIVSHASDTWLADLFETARLLAVLEWPRGVRLRQAYRLLKCWIKYFRILAPKHRGLPRAAISAVLFPRRSQG